MKKIILLFIIAITGLVSNSCTQEVFFRNPAIQAEFNDRLWITDKVAVTSQKIDGYTYYFIQGIRGNETITLRTTVLKTTTYDFGTSNSKTATYSLKLGEDEYLEYDTGLKRGSGFAKITKYDEEAQTISGNFEFEVINKNPLDTINAPKIIFKKGIFYNVPIYQ